MAKNPLLTTSEPLHANIEGVFKTFEGMDAKYTEIVRSYHKTYTSETLTTEAKEQARIDAKNQIAELQAGYMAKAIERLEAADKALRPQVKAISKGDAARQADLMLWTATVPTKSAAELRELWATYKGDSDFMELLRAEIAKRDDLEMQRLDHDIHHTPATTEAEQIGKLRQIFATFAKGTLYPAGLETGGYEFRTIENDLNAYPVTNGATYRQVFSI